MRRFCLLSLLAVVVVAGSTTSVPKRAQSQDIFGLMTAPLRIMRNLGIRGRLLHRRSRARPAATRSREPREKPREAAGASARAIPVAALAWPAAADDLFDFTFARGSQDGFWTHGSYDILSAAMTPRGTSRPRKTAAKSSAADCSAQTAAAEQAGNALADQIAQAITPTAAQQPAFKDLRSALITAYRRIGAACGTPAAEETAQDRVDALAERLWAMRQATLIVRTPLEKLYGELTAEQKATLDGASPRAVSCSADLAAAEAWPGSEIVRAVQPSDKQQIALEGLRVTFAGMAQWLASACPAQPPGTVVARLDAAGERVNTLLYATRIVGRSLGGVYAALNDRQEARLRSVGRQLRLTPAHAADNAQ
ncbi:MAG TPA: Spy/CpxP family protein refolding chaperone [Xanthobacteraceae bacterium]|nr:Spy/CpxP family protein refolding chaperone [Xanthobacteraceae bacterium]